MTGAGAAPASVTATVVFTDIVASTEMLARLGGDATRAVRMVHDDLIADAVAAHNGRVVKSLGDGQMLAFDAARDAIAAAIEVQQGITDHSAREPEKALEVRIGMSAGDVVWREDQGDYFGTAVVEAARLCAAAQGGEILATELVTLLGRDAGTPTQLVGDLELKGLSSPVRTHRVQWAPRSGGAVPLPPALISALASTTFVGRDDVRAR
ncbi:MAG TPA: adenylate/guanylate cyclase domain-containing protein, partial [Mycobacteriales bacterium]|nr:adenylate/guanylate cyclase domain-containing protein [Mycobacteriales bacterium]